MANEPGKGAPGKPVNDSIDELLDGIPAEPMLPKKRARTIDRAASVSPNRRSDDKVIVRDGTDPRERERIEAEAARRQSSTFGTSFLGPNATTQKIVVAAFMMILVLGIYVTVRLMTKAPPQNVRTASDSPPPAATLSAPPPLSADAVPPVPTDVAAAAVAAAPSGSAVTTTRRSALHSGHAGHAGPNAPAVQPVSSAHSAGFSGL